MESPKKQKALFNPLKDNFKYSIRNQDNTSRELVIPANEIAWFDESTHTYMKKHLGDAVYHLEGNPKRDRDLEMADIYARIDITNEFN